MDTIKFEKLQAMNKYHKRNQFYKNLTLYSLATLSCSLLCSSPLWIPTLCSYVNAFFFVSLPNIVSLCFNPKCLFIVGNIIIVFLIGESKFMSSNPSPATEIYDEYVIRSRNLRRHPIPSEEKKEEEDNMEVCLMEESKERLVEEEIKEEDEKEEEQEEERLQEEIEEIEEIEEEDNREQKQEEQGEEEEEEEEEEKEKEKEDIKEEAEGNDEEEDLDGEDQEEEKLGMPTEELNKRVEDFIARMNEQRRLEATLLVYSNA